MRAEGEIILKREELHVLVWSEPMSRLAKRFGLSDVGLAQICKRLQIPRPEVESIFRADGPTVERLDESPEKLYRILEASGIEIHVIEQQSDRMHRFHFPRPASAIPFQKIIHERLKWSVLGQY